MKTIFALVLALSLAGCATNRPPDKFLMATIDAQALTSGPALKTYFLRGTADADFGTIHWQNLRSEITAALAAKGFVETPPSDTADLIIDVFAKTGMDKTTSTYSTPTFVYHPGQTSVATINSSTPRGPVTSTATVQTPGQTVYTGQTQHSVDKYFLRGRVYLRASAWSEWCKSQALEGPRTVWHVDSMFSGDPAGTATEMTDHLLRLSLGRIGENHKSGQMFKEPVQFLFTKSL